MRLADMRLANFRLRAAGLLLCPLLLTGLLAAAVVDRVAVVIDKTVITESEVLDDLRLTQFIDNQPLDLGPAARRQAADKLVDQELIRRELENTGYNRPSAAEGDALLGKFRQDRFHSDAEYRAALQKYGITEDELKQRLLWQLAAIRFTDIRFRPQEPEANAQSADRVSDGAPNRAQNRTDHEAAANSVDRQLDAWLKQARDSAKVTFKPEAFK